MSGPADLGRTLHAFFEDHLRCQKGLRPLTITSYSDALRLFIVFVAADKGCRVTGLALADLTSDRALAFLDHIERERGNAVASRNQRLAVLRCFFGYVGTRRPELLHEAQRVAGVPVKRCHPPRTRYLERDEIERLFAELPKGGSDRAACRDRAVLLFLYNTGARVQEVADLKTSNLELGEKARVHLHGKGDKWRVCPLWNTTAALLRELVEDRAQRDGAVFVARGGKALTRHGLYKIVRRHTVAMQRPGEAISPHSFRHTAAVHLLESGVDVNVIRAWLGHVSLETTNRYAEITLRMKAEALEACALDGAEAHTRRGNSRWRDDPALLGWLKSL